MQRTPLSKQLVPSSSQSLSKADSLLPSVSLQPRPGLSSRMASIQRPWVSAQLPSASLSSSLNQLSSALPQALPTCRVLGVTEVHFESDFESIFESILSPF